MRIVIIGNGVAGIEAAIAVRARQPDWEITIISEESDHFFSRTALMWICTGQLSPRDTEPYERDLYQRQRFERVRDRAVHLDLSSKQVHFEHRDPISYDRLLIACGSKPRRPPWPGSELEGVGHFVTLRHLEWLQHEIYERGTERPAVIGGGLLGMEVVEVLLCAQKKPTFLLRDDWFWPTTFNDDESAFLIDRMREHGVEVLIDHEVRALEGNGRVSAIETDQGRYDADMVVVTIGVEPNTDWLKSAGLDLDDHGGIVADDRLTTSDEHVIAAGDCASVRWFDGQRRPEQLWYTARAQGRIAGRRLLGDDARYERGVWFNSAKVMDVEYTTVGLVNFELEGEDNFYFEETGKVRSTIRIVTQHGSVVGFNALGRRWDHEVFIRWIEERRDLTWVLDHLRQASFDTELVPWISKLKKAS